MLLTQPRGDFSAECEFPSPPLDFERRHRIASSGQRLAKCRLRSTAQSFCVRRTTQQGTEFDESKFAASVI